MLQMYNSQLIKDVLCQEDCPTAVKRQGFLFQASFYNFCVEFYFSLH